MAKIKVKFCAGIKHGRPKSATAIDTIDVLASVEVEPKLSVRQRAQASGISKNSVCRILKTNKIHPYKTRFVQELLDRDPVNRLQFCRWAAQQIEQDPQFYKKLFLRTNQLLLDMDKMTFFINIFLNIQSQQCVDDLTLNEYCVSTSDIPIKRANVDQLLNVVFIHSIHLFLFRGLEPMWCEASALTTRPPVTSLNTPTLSGSYNLITCNTYLHLSLLRKQARKQSYYCLQMWDDPFSEGAID
uniref:HTH psq-type domain-containing protein n=1 Tax=Strigamia maritima TaxID=126957 RepID=T1IHB7_STRMM